MSCDTNVTLADSSLELFHLSAADAAESVEQADKESIKLLSLELFTPNAEHSQYYTVSKYAIVAAEICSTRLQNG